PVSCECHSRQLKLYKVRPVQIYTVHVGNVQNITQRILGRAPVLSRFSLQSLCCRDLRWTHTEVPSRARRRYGQVVQAGVIDGERRKLSGRRPQRVIDHDGGTVYGIENASPEFLEELVRDTC